MQKLLLMVAIVASQILMAQNVGIGTLIPLARLHVTDSSVVFSAAGFAQQLPIPPPIDGQGRRMMWYPTKAAFRVGYTDDSAWSQHHIGFVSFAAGYSTEASGEGSVALGFATHAGGLISTAMGNYTSALGDYSTAMGLFSEAKAYASFAVGRSVIANSFNSISMGSFNEPIIGSYTSTWDPTEPLLILGNGTSSVDKKNALVILKNGNAGIGINNPARPLSFPNTIGKKISLYPGAFGDAGFGVFSNELRIHSDYSGADITFGYDDYSSGFSEKMRIKGNGNVGIGINSPNAPLAFSNTTGPKISLYEGGVNSQYGLAVQSSQLQIYTDAVAAKISFGYYTGGIFTERMYLTNSTGILTVAGTNYPSDARYKKQITRLQNPVDKIMAINGVEYFMRTDEFPSKQFDAKLQVGLIAQEVEKILPQVVQTGEDGYKAIDYAKIVPLLVEGIKEQQKQIDELRKIVEKLIKK